MKALAKPSYFFSFGVAHGMLCCRRKMPFFLVTVLGRNVSMWSFGHVLPKNMWTREVYALSMEALWTHHKNPDSIGI